MTGIQEVVLGLLIFGQAGEHAVENVVVPLPRILSHDPGLLQEVLLDVGSFNDAGPVETNVDVLAEPGGVVIPDRLGVPERCKSIFVVSWAHQQGTAINGHSKEGMQTGLVEEEFRCWKGIPMIA